MKRSEVAAIMAMLKVNYPRYPLEKETLELYAEMLADLPNESVVAAVKRIITKSKWFPTIAEIRQEATRDGSERQGIDAWEDVRRAFGAVGMYRSPSFEDPLVHKAVQALGWHELCASENTVADRARFAELYDGLARRQRERRQLGSVAPPPGLPKPHTRPTLASREASPARLSSILGATPVVQDVGSDSGRLSVPDEPLDHPITGPRDSDGD